MKFEVELKFPVDDLRRVEAALAGLGAEIDIPVKQSDFYYGHPSRDFAQTDEALRIRKVGSKNIITYKGPKIDATTKTRREIEVPLVSGSEGAANIIKMLESLGFSQVAEVTKNRRKANLNFADQQVEVALDEVKGLGEFVELEISTDEAGVDAARTVINQLAEKLGLSGSERRSYLELILEA
ncbi:class IV adenylate cyclase [Blastopirellula sp. JC732]|uniref:Class IV adenylate cyclase n=1 Tax=Blastopirellula sediminis TaxID=2894196 RepID=A0A9X1MRK0_9BACT|nr:class IV adenylate cyclase [Blastopirellula sediminis]MCC9605371.1 class IV adenylate cyclase [Blastopirellula sediminis]MCC9631329.1 class IV adenylate cyclase [Blastopirellula sediminis]